VLCAKCLRWLCALHFQAHGKCVWIALHDVVRRAAEEEAQAGR
jgi:hypothetical protein